MLMLTGLALCDTACAATKRNSRVALQSIGQSPTTQLRNPQSAGTSKPKITEAGKEIAASSRVETTGTVATTKVPASLSTSGQAAAAGSSLNQPPLMTVTTTTTQSPSDPEVEQTSRSLLAFLIGLAIAIAVGLALLFRPSRLRSR